MPNDINVEHDRSLIVSYNYTITPKMVNEFRFGFTNSLINTTFPIQGAAADNQLGLTGISFANHPNTGAFPTFNFSDGTGFTPIGRDKDGPGQSKTMQFTDNLSRTMGKHTLRVGMDARRVFYETVVRWGQSDDFGAFTFNQGVFTGSSFGDFLLGAPNTDFIVASSPNTNEPSVQWGVYAQDQWQVNDRLTVNFGLRWEVLPEFTENQGDIANFDPRNGDVVVPDILLNKTVPSSPLLQANYNAFLVSFNACQLPTRNMSLPCSNVVTASQDHLSQSLRNTYWDDYDPRIGIAFRPFRDNKTVFRAGFGIFTQTPLGPVGLRFSRHPARSALHLLEQQRRRAAVHISANVSRIHDRAVRRNRVLRRHEPEFQGSSNRAMERNHRTPVDIRPGGANHLFRNEFLPDEREGGLQRDPSRASSPTYPVPTSIRALLIRTGMRSTTARTRAFPTTRGSPWKLPKGCRTGCTFRRTTPGPITSATLKATLRAALPRKTSCLRPPTINSTSARLAEMWRACPGNGSC